MDFQVADFASMVARPQIKAEFKERKGDYEYKGIVPDGPPPVGSN